MKEKEGIGHLQKEGLNTVFEKTKISLNTNKTKQMLF